MSLISDYSGNILPAGLVSLYISRTIVLIAGGFMGLFLPVFLLIQYKSLNATIIFYFIGWLAYLLLAPLGARLINVFGIKRCLMIALNFLALFYVSLYFFEKDLLTFTVLALIILTCYRLFFWVPYHTEFAKISEKKIRGKQIGLFDSIVTFLGIIIPVVSGVLIKEFGFQLVFVIVIILNLIAIIPLFFIPNVNEKYSWGYFKTWQEFFKSKNRKMMLAYMGDGAENWVGSVLWPIFIWQLLNGQYLVVGLISSIVTLFAVILQLIIGNYTDKINKRRLMNIGSILYSAGWLIKMFISTAFQIFLASIFHNFALILLRTPFDALMYEKAADSGHYVDEYSTLREMYLQLGRVVIILTILVLIKFLPLNLVFILAAISSLLVNLLPKQSLYETTGLR